MSEAQRRGLFVFGAAVIAAVVASCASVTSPEGGPEDRDAPVVLKTTPSFGAVGVKPKNVVIQFDEVISETPRGAQELRSIVFISPKVGPPEVDWQRNKISIRPRKGWKPNTVYSITVSPGIADLRNNQLDSTIRVVFSTGGEIPKTSITGVVFDWVAGKPSPKALVEAIAVDSTTYQVLADSSGRYDLRYMPAGKYTVRAFADRNNNRELDPLESWDTVGVTITSTANVELYTFPHDTVGLRISDMTLLDSGRVVKITFDKPYAVDQQFTAGTITIKTADSTPLVIAKLETAPARALLDSLQRKAKADSVAAKVTVDTSASARARADSVQRRRRLDSLTIIERTEREARRLAALRGNRPLPPRDTTPPPRMKRPTVYSDLFVTLQQPLAAGAQFRLQAIGMRSLSGTVRSPARTLITPKAAKVDSSKLVPPKQP